MDLPRKIELKDKRTVTVRRLEPADKESFGDFYESIPAESFRFYCPHSLDRENAARFAAKANDEDNFAIVLEAEDKKICGVCWAKTLDKKTSAVMGICLSANICCVGAGQKMIEILCELLAQHGIKHLELSVQLANPGAVKLYKKCGFAVTEQRMRPEMKNFGFPSEPEYLMGKKLG